MVDPIGSHPSSTAGPDSDAALYGSGLPAPEALAPELLSLVDLASDAVIVRTLPDDTVVFWSGGAERLYGWPRDDAVGRHGSALLHTQSALNAASEPLIDLLSSADIWRGELTQTRRDGSSLRVESCLAVRRTEAGRAEVLEIDREIPASAGSGQAEQADGEDARRFRSMAEGASVGVWEIDSGGRTVYANERLAGILRLSVEDIHGATLLDACFPEDHPFISDRLAAAMRGGEKEQFEIRFRRDDGEEAWALASLCSVVHPGQAGERVLGFFIDITSRKRAILELEDRNGRLSRALVESHHRIKNNLQALAGMVDLQILSHADSVPTAEVHRLGQYTRSLASLHDLMTLDLRAHGPGEAISLSRAVSRIVTLLQPLAGDRRVSVRSDEAWLTLKQGSALALLLNELLMNAIRHGEGAISVVATTHEGEIRIEVLDHGQGFPAGFDGSSASGTGLLLVETAVRWDLRGRIAYENRPSGGARVELRFPVEA